MRRASWISQVHLNTFLRNTQRRGGAHVISEAESGAACHMSRNIQGHQKWEEIRNELSPGAFGGSTALLTL